MYLFQKHNHLLQRMGNEELLQLADNDYVPNVILLLNNLVDDEHFTDVSLVCQGDKVIKAHQCVLAMFSPTFRTILVNNPHSKPILFMYGIEYKLLKSIIDFMYLGQTEVEEKYLPEILEIANKLEIKGLMNNDHQGSKGDSKNYIEEDADMESRELSNTSRENLDESDIVVDQEHDYPVMPEVDVEIHNDSVDNEEFPKIKLVKQESVEINSPSIDKQFSCDSCEKSYNCLQNLVRHKKSAHENVKYLCPHCEYVANFSSNLSRHVKKMHSTFT